MAMQLLYNSEAFTVLQISVSDAEVEGAPLRGGFEIVDKSSRKGIYIEGALAEGFQRGVQAIVAQGPDEQALDDFIAGYSALAQQPLLMH
jgi:hypothetical protein